VEELVSGAKRRLCEEFLGILERSLDTQTAESSDFLDARKELQLMGRSDSNYITHFQDSIQDYLALCRVWDAWIKD